MGKEKSLGVVVARNGVIKLGASGRKSWMSCVKLEFLIGIKRDKFGYFRGFCIMVILGSVFM